MKSGQVGYECDFFSRRCFGKIIFYRIGRETENPSYTYGKMCTVHFNLRKSSIRTEISREEYEAYMIIFMLWIQYEISKV